MKRIRIVIPESELDFSFSQSGGKGGQNVNKVATKVILKWKPDQTSSLTEVQRAQVLKVFENRIGNDGALMIVSQEHRSQWQNRLKAMERLNELLSVALTPRKKRRKSKVSKNQKQKRLHSKKQQSVKKSLRRRPGED